MKHSNTNKTKINVRLNTLETSKKRHSLGCALAGVFGFAIGLLLLALIGSGEVLAILLIFGVFSAILMFLYHSSKVTEIEKDILNLKTSSE
jgi:hypothetical protein